MKKRVKLCDFWKVPGIECVNVCRESNMYSVDYSGPIQILYTIPPTMVEEERMRVCPECYKRTGYFIGRKVSTKRDMLPEGEADDC